MDCENHNRKEFILGELSSYSNASKNKMERNQIDFLKDYFVLIPAEYYEASLLVSNVTNACTIDENKVCRHYLYPKVSSYDYVRGAGGYLVNGENKSPPQYHFNDYQVSTATSNFTMRTYLNIEVGTYLLDNEYSM